MQLSSDERGCQGMGLCPCLFLLVGLEVRLVVRPWRRFAFGIEMALSCRSLFRGKCGAPLRWSCGPVGDAGRWSVAFWRRFSTGEFSLFLASQSGVLYVCVCVSVCVCASAWELLCPWFVGGGRWNRHSGSLWVMRCYGQTAHARVVRFSGMV